MALNDPRIVEIGIVRREKPHAHWRIDGVVGPNWHILAIVHRGLASYQVDGEHYTLRRGDLLCMHPGMRRSGMADPRDPWDFTVCGFRVAGRLAAPVQLVCGPRSPVLRLADELRTAWATATRGRQFLALARLHEIVDILTAGGDAKIDNRIRAALEHLATLPPARLPSATTVARTCGLSPSRFRELFRAATGMAFHHWQIVRRLELARSLMLSGQADLTQAATQAGFADTHYFSRMFRRHLGTTPSSCLIDGRG